MKYELKHKLNAIKLYEQYGRYDYPPGIRKDSYRHYVAVWIKLFNDEGIDGLRPKQNGCPLQCLGRHPFNVHDIIQLTCPGNWVHII